jgi:hypothetical protein
MKRILYTKLLILLLTFSVSGKAKFIDSLILVPKHPNNSVLIKLVAYTKFTSGPIFLNKDSLVVNKSINNIQVNTYYSGGPAPSTYRSKDTIVIGKLSSGNYKLIFNLKHRNNETSPIWYSKDSIYFTVADVGTIRLMQSQSLFIYPNPVNNFLTIQSSYTLNNEPYTLTDQTGRQVLIGKLSHRTNLVDLSILPQGFYFLQIGEAKKEKFKIMKQ